MLRRGSHPYAEIATGESHSLARRSDGSAIAWGLDSSGQSSVPALTSGSYSEIAAGGKRSVARVDPPPPCPGPSVYCTAKLNSLGCSPAISSTGTASASAGSGFLLRTDNVLDHKFGLYFYGKTGPAIFPFQGGTLCANPPLVRTSILSSAGTSGCTGFYELDFNAYVATGADPALVAGRQVWAQTWSRDPGFAPPNNTSLSDAVTFSLCP